MGVKVTVRDDETIEDALRRFRELVRRHGPPGTNVKGPKWHKNQLAYYVKPSARRRRDAIRNDFRTHAGECFRRRLVCEIRRRCKRRKMHIGDIPVVVQYPPR